MPGTRTAPTVDGSPVRIDLSVRFVDHTGDKKSVSFYDVGATVIDSEIETLVADLQAGTNASIYEVNVTQSYSSAWQASNALEEVYENVASHITVLNKDGTGRTQNTVIPAVLDDLLVDGTNNPDPANAALGDIITSALAVINGGVGGSGTYTAIQARFNSVKQINPSVPV